MYVSWANYPVYATTETHTFRSSLKQIGTRNKQLWTLLLSCAVYNSLRAYIWRDKLVRAFIFIVSWTPVRVYLFNTTNKYCTHIRILHTTTNMILVLYEGMHGCSRVDTARQLTKFKVMNLNLKQTVGNSFLHKQTNMARGVQCANFSRPVLGTDTSARAQTPTNARERTTMLGAHIRYRIT